MVNKPQPDSSARHQPLRVRTFLDHLAQRNPMKGSPALRTPLAPPTEA